MKSVPLLSQYASTLAIQARAIAQVCEQGVVPRDAADWSRLLRALHREALRQQLPAFTTREHDILALVSRAYAFKTIGFELGLAESTVRYYWQRIRRKLRCRTTAAALVRVGHYAPLWWCRDAPTPSISTSTSTPTPTPTTSTLQADLV